MTKIIGLVLLMSAMSFGGAAAFRQYVDSRDPLLLIAGFSLYALSNCAFIYCLQEGLGISRAMVVGSAAQIILASLFGLLWWGEKVDTTHVVAVSFACAAMSVSLYQLNG